jgi:hypothetical protein
LDDAKAFLGTVAVLKLTEEEGQGALERAALLGEDDIKRYLAQDKP